MPEPSKVFDAAEFARTIERVRQGQDLTAPQPIFDPKQHQDAVAEAVRGRKIADYRQALGNGGFTYWPPNALPTLQDGRKQTRGLWRNNYLRKAFTTEDVLAWFETPEDLWKWIQKQKAKHARRSR
jgi:hypothetical protein